MTLQPGQYQLGDIVFGKGTIYPVSSIEIQAYNVQAQDAQLIRSDEMQFGFDSFQPAPIIFEMGVLDFRAIPNMANYVGTGTYNDSSYDALQHLALAWRGDYVRNSWGSVTGLKFCDRDGRVRVWYGRPRKFQATKKSDKSEFYTVHAEFQRVDTLCYDETESSMQVGVGETNVINRSAGQADTWFRVVGYGPLDHPVIGIGESLIDLDANIPAGTAFEISSYPWSRRAVTSDGVNIASKLIGETQYLDRLILRGNAATSVNWTANQRNTWEPDLNNNSWSEPIQNLPFSNLPSSFTTLGGKAFVRLDELNFAGAWVKPARYIASANMQEQTAIVYNAKQFTSSSQYAEAQLVNPTVGRSAIVIMSSSNMSNYAMVEISTGPTNNYLRIRNGTAWNSYGTIRSYWKNTSVGGWKESDKVGIGYDPATSKFTAYLNGEEKCSWVDSTHIVSTSNRYQGFIFDMDGNLLKLGIGFRNIVAYDKALVQPAIGDVYVLWRNAYPSAL